MEQYNISHNGKEIVITIQKTKDAILSIVNGQNINYYIKGIISNYQASEKTVEITEIYSVMENGVPEITKSNRLTYTVTSDEAFDLDYDIYSKKAVNYLLNKLYEITAFNESGQFIYVAPDPA